MGYVDGICTYDIFLPRLSIFRPASGLHLNENHTTSMLSKTEYDRGYKEGRAARRREMASPGRCSDFQYSGI